MIELMKTQRMLELERLLGTELESLLDDLCREGWMPREIGLILGISKPTCLNYLYSLTKFRPKVSGDSVLGKSDRSAWLVRRHELWSRAAKQQCLACSPTEHVDPIASSQDFPANPWKESWRNPARREALSARTRKLWQDPGFRRKMFPVLKENRVKSREKREEGTRSFLLSQWERNDFRVKISAAMRDRMRDRWNDQTYRKQMSSMSKRLWKNPAYRGRQLLVPQRMTPFVYKPALLRMMLDWKGTTCSYLVCNAELSKKSRNIWHACRYHNSLVRKAVKSASEWRKATLAKFGLELI